MIFLKYVNNFVVKSFNKMNTNFFVKFDRTFMNEKMKEERRKMRTKEKDDEKEKEEA